MSFGLSLRDVELILAERGGHGDAREHPEVDDPVRRRVRPRLQRRRPKPGATWHLDEVFLRINGALHYLWRAVDQRGAVLDILVQDRRDAAAAKRFFQRLLAGLQFTPRRLVTDGLRSYGVARARCARCAPCRRPAAEQPGGELASAHAPTGTTDAAVKSPEHAQRFLSSHALIYSHFRPRRHLISAGAYRRARDRAFRI
jgi:putative transposase